MKGEERTPQRLDPLGTFASWPLVPIVGVVIIGYALYSSLSHLDQFTNPALAWFALALIIATCVYYSIRSRPEVAPFGRLALVIVLVGCAGASLLFTASVWGADRIVQDDWGQIAIALTVISLPLYRPIGDVIVGAVISALVVGTAAAFEAPFLSITTPPLVYLTVAATPVLALALAGSAYAWVMTGDVLAWGEAARESQRRLDPEIRESAARIVNQERVTVLNAASVPYLVDILQRDALTSSDIARARDIAAALRRIAVDDVDRGWLEETVLRAVDVPPADAVTDPERLEEGMGTEVRGILSAVISALAEFRGFDKGSLQVELARKRGRPNAALTAVIDARRPALRREFLPYLAALRSVCPDAALDARDGSLTLRFTYSEV